LVPWIGGILSLLATGPLMIGCYALFLAIIRRASPGIGMLFQGFNRFGSALGLYLLVAVFNLLWCLLAILPGLILTGLLFAGHISLAAVSRGASPFLPGMTPGLVILPFLAIVIPVLVVSTIVQLRYAQAYFILIDQPEGGCLSALRASIGMMRGNKWKLFCLYWRFFGWAVLCLFTCGIGTLWLLPYMMASYARFYEDVRT
jgi:uncharacterized membrane protein